MKYVKVLCKLCKIKSLERRAAQLFTMVHTEEQDYGAEDGHTSLSHSYTSLMFESLISKATNMYNL